MSKEKMIGIAIMGVMLLCVFEAITVAYEIHKVDWTGGINVQSK